MKHTELLFIKDLEKMIARSRQTIRRWYYKNIFPKPVLISNRLCWRKVDIEKWIKDNFNGASE